MTAHAGVVAETHGAAGLVADRDYNVQSVKELPLLPGLVLLFLGLGALMLAWRRDGR